MIVFNAHEGFLHADHVAITRDAAAAVWGAIKVPAPHRTRRARRLPAAPAARPAGSSQPPPLNHHRHHHRRHHPRTPRHPPPTPPAAQSGIALGDPSLLSQFTVTAHVDPKHFVFKSWCLFPALKPPAPYASTPLAPLDSAFPDPAPAAALAAACDARLRSDPQPAWVVLAQAGGGFRAVPLAEGLPALLSPPAVAAVSEASAFLAYADPSSQEGVAGWPLRNLLLLLSHELGRAGRASARVPVVSVRVSRGRVDASRTLACVAAVEAVPAGWPADPAELGCYGWERGADGRAGVTTVRLRDQMDPVAMAESAVDLNLRLMRWRAAPGVDLDRIAGVRALLLGSGTLGCAVARTLLAWNVRRITFVDNSTVSMSNPVRQSLFTFEDAAAERPKAEAAAAALARIFPAAAASAHQLSIPMPGHPLHPSEELAAEESHDRLAQLVREHDVVFLLTDSRESRWLPTVLGALHRKTVITAALGFDTFVVVSPGRQRAGRGALPARPRARSPPPPAPVPRPRPPPARSSGTACPGPRGARGATSATTSRPRGTACPTARSTSSAQCPARGWRRSRPRSLRSWWRPCTRGRG